MEHRLAWALEPILATSGGPSFSDTLRRGECQLTTLNTFMCLVSAINGPSSVPARTDDGAGYSAEHLVA